eukprot:scpid88004/ scgid2142/ 
MLCSGESMRKPMSLAIAACGQGTTGGGVIAVLPAASVARNTISCFMMKVALVSSAAEGRHGFSGTRLMWYNCCKEWASLSGVQQHQTPSSGNSEMPFPVRAVCNQIHMLQSEEDLHQLNACVDLTAIQMVK